MVLDDHALYRLAARADIRAILPELEPLNKQTPGCCGGNEVATMQALRRALAGLADHRIDELKTALGVSEITIDWKDGTSIRRRSR